MAITQQQALEVVQRAKSLLQKGWIKGAWARDHNKKHVDPWDESACEFCVEGAFIGAAHFEPNAEEIQTACVTMFQVANPEFAKDPTKMTKILAANNPGSHITSSSVIPTVNDSHNVTHKQILRMCDNTLEFIMRSKWQ